jgi:hypothetical protein
MPLINYAVVGLVVTAIILFYILYLYVYVSWTNLATSLDLKKGNANIAITSNPNTTRFAIGLWVFVNSWDNNSQKNIISMIDSHSFSTIANPTNPFFQLSLGTTSPSLTFSLQQQPSGSAASLISTTLTSNFPLQKWTFVTISIDSNYIDYYLDGKLVKSVRVNGSVATPSGFINIVPGSGSGPGPDIQLTQLYRWNVPISPQEVWTQYLRGNGESWMTTQYGMNVGILQNNAQTASFRVI